MSEEKLWDDDALWDYVVGQANPPTHSAHGEDHWRRVREKGLLIARHTPTVDTDVIKLFALFHDSCRLNDGHDPEHGARGATYATQLRNTWFTLNDDAFEKLHYACTWHTDQDHHADPHHWRMLGCGPARPRPGRHTPQRRLYEHRGGKTRRAQRFHLGTDRRSISGSFFLARMIWQCTQDSCVEQKLRLRFIISNPQSRQAKVIPDGIFRSQPLEPCRYIFDR